MRKPKIAEAMGRKLSMTGLKIKKHSPEILVVAGVAGMVTSAVMACKATTKIGAIMEENKKQTEIIKTAIEQKEVEGVSYSEEDGQKDLRIVKVQTGLKVAKTYAPAIAVGVVSVASIFAGHNMLRKRNVALAAAYTAIDSSFKNYRKNVVDRFGEELDKELKYNIKTKEIEERVVDEGGNEKTVKKTMKIVDGEKAYSDYARFYDDGCAGWMKDSEHNLWFLKQQERYANDKLRANGHLFLNEVYDMLGIPRTKAGNIVGWIYESKTGDGYVDFGIYDKANSDFVNGYERVMIVDFNVDGPIIDLI